MSCPSCSIAEIAGRILGLYNPGATDEKPALNPDHTVNWVKWHELLKDSKLPYMTFDPPQKKEASPKAAATAISSRRGLGSGRPHPAASQIASSTNMAPIPTSRSSDADAWLGKMLQRDAPNCPDFLRGVWWMRDNVANETMLTFQDGEWRQDGRVGMKDAGTNWTTGTSMFGSLLAAIKRFPVTFEIEPGENPKWMGLRNGDDWIYLLGEEDKGKLLYPDGSPVDFIPGLDLLRVSVPNGDPYGGVFYQYLVRCIAFKDCDGNIVKTQYYDELKERSTRPTPQGCCCNLFLCNVSDEDYPNVYDALDDSQIVIYTQDKYPYPAPGPQEEPRRRSAAQSLTL
eukprot:CAMPEP_0181466982 /NCGR_PEP_ID=MMETSP1110-20121109/36739_1 /TAXON_ID=174948 /ORGANISM="Symbiodinium sp., Strain CCMP421" /LENGTH=341 /DNA_ID=CAMNT_0023591785 /DNA_START=47 /DNA_END=1073 /DNA_ORIENTATION=+